MKKEGIVVDYDVRTPGQKVGEDLNPLTDYRKGRIYLDDYPEQKELRKEWFEKTRFTYKKLLEMKRKFCND